MIKHMSLTEEMKLIREYVEGRNLILKNYNPESEAGKEGLDLLQKEYAKLLSHYKKNISTDPTKKLKTLQKRLEDLFQLLNIWSQYVEIIYMPESEINMISAV